MNEKEEEGIKDWEDGRVRGGLGRREWKKRRNRGREMRGIEQKRMGKERREQKGRNRSEEEKKNIV